MSVPRRAGYLLTANACAFVLAYLIPEQIDRQDYTRAVVAYARNPTAENEATPRAQRRVNDRIHLIGSSVLGLILVAVGYGIWSRQRLITRLKHRTDSRDLRQ